MLFVLHGQNVLSELWLRKKTIHSNKWIRFPKILNGLNVMREWKIWFHKFQESLKKIHFISNVLMLRTAFTMCWTIELRAIKLYNYIVRFNSVFTKSSCELRVNIATFTAPTSNLSHVDDVYNIYLSRSGVCVNILMRASDVFECVRCACVVCVNKSYSKLVIQPHIEFDLFAHHFMFD